MVASACWKFGEVESLEIQTLWKGVSSYGMAIIPPVVPPPLDEPDEPVVPLAPLPLPFEQAVASATASTIPSRRVSVPKSATVPKERS
jgi:hypothetical protein